MDDNKKIVAEIQKKIYQGLKNAANCKSPFVRKLSISLFRKYEIEQQSTIIKICEELFKSRNTWEHMFACAWINKIITRLDSSYFPLFETWLKKYIFSWGSCDDYCKRILNPLWEMDYKLFKYIEKWTRNKNKWVRRASAVTFIKSGNGGYVSTTPIKYLFQIALNLMEDKDLHVQKGYGWMLKASSIYHQKEVYNFVMKNRNKMARTAFRYSIEKLPKKMKMNAMRK